MKRKSKLKEGLILPPTWRLVTVHPEWTKPDFYCESPHREGMRTGLVTSVETAIMLARKMDAAMMDGKFEELPPS